LSLSRKSADGPHLSTGEHRESTFLFQQLSIALQSRNAVAFFNTSESQLFSLLHILVGIKASTLRAFFQHCFARLQVNLLLPIFFVVVVLSLVLIPLIYNAFECLITLAIIASGVPVYLLLVRPRHQPNFLRSFIGKSPHLPGVTVPRKWYCVKSGPAQIAGAEPGICERGWTLPFPSFPFL